MASNGNKLRVVEIFTQGKSFRHELTAEEFEEVTKDPSKLASLATALCARRKSAGNDENVASCNLPPKAAEGGAENSTVREWGEGETRLLLDQYKQYLPHVGPMKRFARQKNMWAQISSDIHTQLGSVKTELQCENRYKTLLKRRGGAVKHNNTSGSNPVPVPFKDELAQIRSIDDSISPEVLRGVGRVEQKPIATPGPSCAQNLQGSGPPPVKKRRESSPVAEVLWRIHEEKEKQRQQRHKEKMDILMALLHGSQQQVAATDSDDC